MTTILSGGKHSRAETITYFVGFGPSMPAGTTISNGSAVHVPSSGSAAVPTVSVDSTNKIVSARLGGLTQIGAHKLKVYATLSNGEVHEVVLEITVPF